MVALLSDEHGMSRTAANRDSFEALKSLKQGPLWRREKIARTCFDALIFPAARIHGAKVL
jgi:hypothetical protein